MKTKLLLILILAVNTYGFSQVSIPDPYFEQALIDISIDSDGIINGQILNSDTDGVLTMDVSGKNISDLKGVEAFADLEILKCYENNLTVLDFSSNTKLKHLICHSNQIFKLIINSNLDLQSLICNDNVLPKLDLHLNTQLTELSCNNNLLTKLNVQNGNNTNFTVFNSTTNPNLLCITVDDPIYSLANWSNIDVASSFNHNCDSPETYVPDNNFEAYLEAYSMGNGIANDDYVTTSNINTVTNLNVNYLNIADLTGIEDFISLTDLDCGHNQLTILDLSTNIALEYIECANNQLTSLDVATNAPINYIACENNQLTSLDFSNTSIEYLFCQLNQLTSLDISNNTVLTVIDCQNNQLSNINISNSTALLHLHATSNLLTSIDVSTNTALTYLYVADNLLTSLDVGQNTLLTRLSCFNNQLTSLNVKNGNNTNFITFEAQNNPNLTCIEVDDAAWSATNWLNKDPASSFSTNCHYGETYVPDDVFEQRLINLGYDSGALDDYVLTANINTVTQLSINNLPIADLTGIEGFTALEIFSYANNSFNSFDISQNLSLKIINGGYGTITSLDVSHNIALEELYCYATQLNSLDVSQNTALKILNCSGNSLVSLDLTQNTSLIELSAINCQLTSLNVKNGNNTNFLQFDTTANPNLTCIEVDDAAWSTTNWTNIDPASSFSANCHYGETYVPDDNFENYLETHDASDNIVAVGASNSMGNGIANDDYVTTAAINSVTDLDINTQNISDLTGIEDFSALLYLTCNNNQLTSLDTSQNTLLEILWCQNNQLVSLDVSQNTSLYELAYESNQLTSLNVKNTNNTNFVLFWGANNPNLTCIEVDNAAYSTTNWTSIDPASSFNHNCANPETYVPDDNFENYLETHDASDNVVAVGASNSMGNGIAYDDYVTTTNINTVTSLYVDNQNIANLTGVEDFIALTVLSCDNNQLINLNVTQNTLLAQLHCRNNQLIALDVTQNVALAFLMVSNNQLTNLDVTQNTSLFTLHCYLNQLTSLDITQNTNLVALHSFDNQLMSLNTTQNTLLAQLLCYDNQLTSLNVTQNTALTYLSCYDNQLTSLDVSQNTSLNRLYSHNNQLISLNVKNGNNTNFTNFEAQNNPNLTCIEVDNAIWSAANWTNIHVASNFVNDQTECSLLGVEDFTYTNFSTYPNPTKHVLNIAIELEAEYRLSNMQGQIIKTGKLKNGNNTLNTSYLSSGIYFLTVKTDEGMGIKKIIKQ